MEFYKEISSVEIHLIDIVGRRREPDQDKVGELAESISSNGLLNPIWVSCVRNENKETVRYRLIAGLHRVEAVKKLKQEWIDARICDCSDIEARLAEITENLHRADLTPEDAALQRAEYARLTAVKRGELDPDEPVSQLATVTRGGGRDGENAGGIRATARELGVSNDTLRRDIAIASLTEDERASARPEGKPASQAALLRVVDAKAGKEPKAQTEDRAIEKAIAAYNSLSSYGQDQFLDAIGAVRTAS
jgi:ParB family transcriptional regulator, chromosome partitioning protein